jgi:S1-C subfamily serine protease
MFADAWERAGRATRHVMTCARYADGSTSAEGATFLVLNAMGWVVTAGHVFAAPQRAHLTHPLGIERWWGADEVREAEVQLYDDVDLAICRLEPPPATDGVLRLRRASTQRLGTALLTLGYPFDACDVRFDAGANEFQFAGGTRGLYGTAGILSRIIDEKTGPGGYPRQYLETSSPALIGQSGGPVVDGTGAVWGIQVRTQHEALGFRVPVDLGGTVVTEHQVRNTAISVQTSTLEALLERHGVDAPWEG